VRLASAANRGNGWVNWLELATLLVTGHLSFESGWIAFCAAIPDGRLPIHGSVSAHIDDGDDEC
jgi:hypothetical protein